MTLNDIMKTVDISKNFTKNFKKFSEAGITLTNNQLWKWGIMKVIKTSGNRAILLKGTTAKTTSQEGGFLNFLRPLMTAGLPLIKIVLTSLANRVLIPLGLPAGMSAADAAIQRKIYGQRNITLIISNEEMEDIMKIVNYLKN